MDRSHQRGFTLVELVAVIALLGIVSVGVFGFIGSSTQVYVNAYERDQLLSDARYVLKRFNRELRGAMPGSVRITESSGFACMEYVPIMTSTQYGDIPVAPEAKADQIELVPLGLSHDSNQYRIYVYPLDSSEVYIDSGNVPDDDNKVAFLGSDANTQPSTDDPAKNMVELVNTSGIPDETHFSDDSPAKRLYVADNPVAFCLENGEIRRYTSYGYMSSLNKGLMGTGVLMAENLVNDLSEPTDTPFRVATTTLQSNAVVQLRLLFERNDQVVVFHNEIHVSNSP
ncbi:hypothetical protein HMF8227_00284 [Saliniradius amylolyticus]|uniref:MSHA biogenesis protein MshO n=1 Tax=Saliniradius amylolyticus TaxID=2183582 RepID=A0A2S2DZS8_9ALTE|nr:prepilin-type N-terminal cleavage/methylation domain-containing protein [Saliniradius amylolyticus]AWL10792.1 hypothetical protein HMF8227_00284 [Saliniradius amylolyticus]